MVLKAGENRFKGQFWGKEGILCGSVEIKKPPSFGVGGESSKLYSLSEIAGLTAYSVVNGKVAVKREDLS